MTDNRQTHCPLCASQSLYYSFSKETYRVERCATCGFMLLNPQPDDQALASIYNENYFLGQTSGEDPETVAAMKGATARRYLKQIQAYDPLSLASPSGRVDGVKERLLEIGCGRGEFLIEAQKAGFEVTGVEYSPAAVAVARKRLGATGRVLCGELENLGLPQHGFDVCVLCDVLEHVRNPIGFLKHVHTLLKPQGSVFIATPSLDSWSARLLKENWMEFKLEHLFYFQPSTLQNALMQSGFREILVQPNWKDLNLDYVSDHFRRYRVPFFSTLLHALTWIVPRPIRKWNVPVVASGMAVLARAQVVPQRQKLSVIVPVYNEAKTCASLLDKLLEKEISGLDMEVVIVESNSTDGSREIVARYQDHPRVRLIFEDRPRGKGHAIRTGFGEASGDYILIQDADLEYDLEDYENLLEPLVHGRAAFVLGARHGGNVFKMRYFARQPLLSLFLNMGHWFFTFLVNWLFWLKLKDPFTMFKVFHRDCLYGLEFACNRFDFDFELVIKLARKGYTPLEIPVNYRSRSFKEGKKVSVWRDPWTWLKCLVWLRFTRLGLSRKKAPHQEQAGFKADSKWKAA